MNNAPQGIATRLRSPFADMPLTKYQQGFSLLECIMVMALMTLIGIWGASQWAQSLEEGAADATLA